MRGTSGCVRRWRRTSCVCATDPNKTRRRPRPLDPESSRAVHKMPVVVRFSNHASVDGMRPGMPLGPSFERPRTGRHPPLCSRWDASPSQRRSHRWRRVRGRHRPRHVPLPLRGHPEDMPPAPHLSPPSGVFADMGRLVDDPWTPAQQVVRHARGRFPGIGRVVGQEQGEFLVSRRGSPRTLPVTGVGSRSGRRPWCTGRRCRPGANRPGNW